MSEINKRIDKLEQIIGRAGVRVFFNAHGKPDTPGRARAKAEALAAGYDVISVTFLPSEGNLDAYKLAPDLAD